MADAHLVVMGGPSLAFVPAPLREAIEILPPARRGDVERLRDERPPGRLLIVDGLFGSALAITPTECRQLLEAGWQLYGCSSMGALRASELWSVGMQGLGEVYAMLRSGVICDDTEVAVAYHPDDMIEITLSLVHLRGMLRALRRDYPPTILQSLFCSARRLHWLERDWGSLAALWSQQLAPDHALPDLIRTLGKLAHEGRCNPKTRDAENAIRTLLALDELDFLAGEAHPCRLRA